MKVHKDEYGYSYIKSCFEFNFINAVTDWSKLNEYISIQYDGTKVNQVLTQYVNLFKFNKLFPTVFIPTFVKSPIEYTFINKIRFNRIYLPYKMESDKILQLGSFSYIPLVFHLQFLDFVKSHYGPLFDKGEMGYYQITEIYLVYKSIYKSDNISKIEETPVFKYLSREIGKDYSYGKLIDFADNIYDLYKQTEISVKNFRLIFYSFAQHLDVIGSEAFDHYMESRDSTLSWKKAIESFLISNYCLSPELAYSISSALIY